MKRRIQDVAGSLKRLTELYDSGDNSEDVFCCGMENVAQILENIAQTANVHTIKDKKIKRSFAAYGINASKIAITDNNYVIVCASMLKHGCIRTVNLEKIVSCILNRPLVSVSGNRGVVTENEEEYIFKDAPDYFTLFGQIGVSKYENGVSGDCFTYMESDGVVYLALADGMGTGVRANHASAKMLELFEGFMECGFMETVSMKMINHIFAVKNQDNPVTFDGFSFDMLSGVGTFLKQGGAASFIKEGKKVHIVKPSSLPAGVLEEAAPDVVKRQFNGGEYVIMVSDGVMDALPFYDKEGQFSNLIEKMDEASPELMAKRLYEEIMFYPGECRRDDMTILVLGIWRSLKNG